MIVVYFICFSEIEFPEAYFTRHLFLFTLTVICLYEDDNMRTYYDKAMILRDFHPDFPSTT